MLRWVHARKCQLNRCLLGKYDNQKPQANVSQSSPELWNALPEEKHNEGALCWSQGIFSYLIADFWECIGTEFESIRKFKRSLLGLPPS